MAAASFTTSGTPPLFPGIMREDMDIPQIIAYNPEPFTPKVRDHNSVLNGVDESLLPELGGFYGTKVKKRRKRASYGGVCSRAGAVEVRQRNGGKLYVRLERHVVVGVSGERNGAQKYSTIW